MVDVINPQVAKDYPATHWMERRLLPNACQNCGTCGWIATDDDASPAWQWWTLPYQSQLAVMMGLVGFTICPACDGTGIVPGTQLVLGTEPEE